MWSQGGDQFELEEAHGARCPWIPWIIPSSMQWMKAVDFSGSSTVFRCFIFLYVKLWACSLFCWERSLTWQFDPSIWKKKSLFFSSPRLVDSSIRRRFVVGTGASIRFPSSTGLRYGAKHCRGVSSSVCAQVIAVNFGKARNFECLRRYADDRNLKRWRPVGCNDGCIE